MSPGGPPKFPTNEAPRSPNKKKGPVSKLETPEPIVPPSPQLQTSTEYLTNITKLLLSKREPQKGDLDHAAIEVRDQLEDIGLNNFIEVADENDEKNYSKNKSGEVQFTAPITPWKVRLVSGRHQIETLFNEEHLKEAIAEAPDTNIQKECTDYLEKIKTLLEEEKVAYQEDDNARLIESGPMVGEIEAAFVAFAGKHNVEALAAIVDGEEAQKSSERIAAKNDLLAIFAKLNTLKEKTNISQERHSELYKKYQELTRRAVGMISGGKVDHTR